MPRPVMTSPASKEVTVTPIPPFWPSDQLESLVEVLGETVDGDTVLGHGVAVAYRHRRVVEAVEVVCDHVRGADLVLTAVASPDRLGDVELQHVVTTETVGELRGRAQQLRLLGQGQDRHLIGRQ